MHIIHDPTTEIAFLDVRIATMWSCRRKREIERALEVDDWGGGIDLLNAVFCSIKALNRSQRKHLPKKKFSFWHCLKQIKHWLHIYESIIYSFQSDQTKIGGVTLIGNTEFASRQISKRGSTLAARNSVLKSPYPYPPLPYIFWTVWT